VKSFLQQLVSGLGGAAYQGTQGALQRLGIPTDYEKQQNALKMGLQQQQQNSLEGLRQTQADQNSQRILGMQADLAPIQLPNDPKYGPFAGQILPRAAAQKIAETYDKMATSKDIAQTKISGAGENALALEKLKQVGGNPRDHVLRSVNGVIGLYSKRDGSLIKPIGTDTVMISPDARYRAMARYGVSNVMDNEGNPTAVNRLTQLATGAPTMNEKATQTLQGDKLGATTYLAANARVEKNLPVLQDEVQRGIIARATQEVDRNPGAIDSILNSSLQEGLSPEGADLIAAMKQMNEFGATFKKYTGNNGVATDNLRTIINSNQPSTANSLATNRALLQQDRTLATQVLGNLARPGKYTVPSKSPSTTGAPAAPSTPTPAPAAGGGWGSKYGGVPVK